MFSQQQNDSTIVLLMIFKNLKKRNFLKMRKNLPFETFQAFCVFSCRLDMFVTTPAPQFDKTALNYYFSPKKLISVFLNPNSVRRNKTVAKHHLTFVY